MSAIILQFRPMKALPNRLREIRLAKGWSQQRLADAVNCSKMQISTLERGEQSLDLMWMRRLSTPLGVEPGELLLPQDNQRAAQNEDEARLLEAMRAMPENVRAQFISIGEAMADIKQGKSDQVA